ncbi:Down syndrome cell adhesion molecule-like protein Dscam2 [Armadillidium vulgare]|nr:Down syndrome cell adhesion molecule-like protein Dscam2 [Armadillidium vulgare]
MSRNLRISLYALKVRHILVPNTDVDSSWKKITGLQNGETVTVWVTASSSGGEGPSTSKATITLASSSSLTPKPFGPFPVSSQLLWKVSINSAVTLRCRSIGYPRPSLSWLKEGVVLKDDHRHQILPGGDLHLIRKYYIWFSRKSFIINVNINEKRIRNASVFFTAESSDNYTCRTANSLGEESLNFRVLILTSPSPPKLRVIDKSRTSLNISISSYDDGGAPILGFKLYHKHKNEEWKEIAIAKSASKRETNAVIRSLPCGSDIQIYATSWNSQGVSPSSEILEGSTKGTKLPKPDPSTIVQVNASCVILRLYAWPETMCPIRHWKVDGKHETANEWGTVFPKVGRESKDRVFCDLQRTEHFLLGITAYSDAGPTTVKYKVSLQDDYSGWAMSERVQEITTGTDSLLAHWVDPHIIAGIVSAFLLTVAAVICICVVVKKRYQDSNMMSKTLKDKESRCLPHQYRDVSEYHVYSPLPSKKSKSLIPSSEIHRNRSKSSLGEFICSDDEILNASDIYPYATFRGGGMDETLQYGIALHAHSGTSRDCFEGAQRRSEEFYSSIKDNCGRLQYKESDVDASYHPSKRVLKLQGRRSRPNSNAFETINPETEAKLISEASTMQIDDERFSRDNPKQNRNKSINNLPNRTKGNQYGSPQVMKREFNHSSPISALYDKQTDKKDNDSKDSSPGQHVRLPARENSASSSGSIGSMASCTPSCPLDPPSAFSDSKELSETECDRVFVKASADQTIPKTKPKREKKQRRLKT